MTGSIERRLQTLLLLVATGLAACSSEGGAGAGDVAPDAGADARDALAADGAPPADMQDGGGRRGDAVGDGARGELAGPPTTLGEAGFTLVTDPATHLPALADAAGGVLLAPAVGGAGDPAFAPLAWATASEDVRFLEGAYGFREELGPWQAALSASPIEVGADGAVRYTVTTAEGALAVTVSPVARGVARVRVAAPAEAGRVALSFACTERDRFFGFGAQANAAEQRGEVVPIWVSEQGIGKTLTDETTPTLFGRPHDSYFPVPFTLTNRGFGLLVETLRRSVFDLCATHADTWRVVAWDNALTFVVFLGPEPLTVVERFTAHTGRARPLPPWAWGPWIAVQLGSAAVRERAALLRSEHIPCTAIWSQDWIGGELSLTGGYALPYHWEWDPEVYPDLPGLSAGLHDAGFRLLGYFNPFVRPGFREWDEATANGYLLHKPDGSDYVFNVISKPGSVVDLTNPAARDWVKGYLATGEALGLDGWMADFGEWVPFDAVGFDGRTGAELSSDYPRLWQTLHREFWDEARPDGDHLYFVRSGYTGSQATSQAVWAGDQNTDWSRADGLPTVISIGTSLGISGVPFYGHDIAGFSFIPVISTPSTKELYFRWTEVGAFSPIMRTHEGINRAQNWNYDKDAETMAHFRFYADVHMRLVPYLQALELDATTRGWPLMRHLVLGFPDDAEVWGRHDDFLLGDALLVAPVVDESERRDVYLPAGRFYDFWDGTAHDGPAHLDVVAPLTAIPVFARAGALVPLLPPGVDTLLPTTDPDVVAADANTPLHVRAYLGAAGERLLADGTVLALASAAAAPGPTVLSVADRVLAACDGAGDTTPCLDLPAVGTRVVVRNVRAGQELTGQAAAGAPVGLRLGVSGGPAARPYVLELVY